ncbi:MAG: arylsulfatase [Pseudomonadota bacterium]
MRLDFQRHGGPGWHRWRHYRGLLLTLSLTAALASGAELGQDPRPNIVLIVADDLGYADLGSFGSRIRTPNIDHLASQGIRFTQFHTAPQCAPTRAMLFSGNNNHVAGVGRQYPSALLSQHLPGYEGHLSDRVVPFPRLLRAAGYHTYIAGKWHLGKGAMQSPKAAGFERSFVLTQGAGHHWHGKGFRKAGSLYREDGREVSWPEGAYSTEFYTDKLISYLEQDRDDDRPFLVVATYTSPHWPLQVPADELQRYRGDYDVGYDALREENFANLKAAGIVPQQSELPPRNSAITPWNALAPEDRRREARKMELYAAMVENLDTHVGRLLDYLRQRDLYDETLVLFMSDNGAAQEDFYASGPYRAFIRANYDNAYEKMGTPESWVAYGAAWAEAGSAPFSRFKGYAREGGITAPLIIAGAGVTPRGVINRNYLTVMDLAPTFLEVGKADYPADGYSVPLGNSMTGLLQGDATALHGEDHVTTLYHRGHGFIRQGFWKLVSLEPPFDESALKLFNLENDPGETTDLRDREPERYAALLELWRTRRVTYGIVLPQDL